MDYHCYTIITHWMPIITFCPVNGLPDFIFVRVTYKDEFAELYKIRKLIRKRIAWRRMFMEDIAKEVSNFLPSARKIEVRLLFGRHTAIEEKGEQNV